MSPFELVSAEAVYEGEVVTLEVRRYRHADGAVVRREAIGHPGACVVLAIDEDTIWMVRQPREVVGEQALLELPAGKYDVAGEDRLDTARRELAEEAGLHATTWRHVTGFYTGPGILEEWIDLFLAEGLREASGHALEEERIEVVRWPRSDLDGAIEACHDAKSLVGLLWLRAYGA